MIPRAFEDDGFVPHFAAGTLPRTPRLLRARKKWSSHGDPDFRVRNGHGRRGPDHDLSQWSARLPQAYALCADPDGKRELLLLAAVDGRTEPRVRHHRPGN